MPSKQWPTESHAWLGSFDEWMVFYQQHRYSNDVAYSQALAQENGADIREVSFLLCGSSVD